MQADAEVEPWFARELRSVLVAIGELAGEKGRDMGAELKQSDAVHVGSWGLAAPFDEGRIALAFPMISEYR